MRSIGFISQRSTIPLVWAFKLSLTRLLTSNSTQHIGLYKKEFAERQSPHNAKDAATSHNNCRILLYYHSDSTVQNSNYAFISAGKCDFLRIAVSCTSILAIVLKLEMSNSIILRLVIRFKILVVSPRLPRLIFTLIVTRTYNEY